MNKRNTKLISLFRLHGNKIGGTESACNQLSKLLSNDYFIEQYYLLDGNENTSEKANKINVLSKNKILIFIMYFFRLRLIAKRYDICISTDVATSVLLLMHKLLGLKSEVYCWEHYPFNKNSKFWTFLFEKCFLYKLSKSIVCISPLAKLDFGFCKNIAVIPNSVKNVYKTVLHENKPMLKCLYIGRVVKDKGVERIADLFSRADPDRYCLTVVGGGDQLVSLMLKYKGKNNIKFDGPSDAVTSYYEDHDVFVSGSFYECFPITVLEAMSHGLPVVSMDTSGGTIAVLADSEAGFICENGNDFMIKLEYFNEADNRNFCGAKGFSYLNSHYSNESVKNKWLELLDGTSCEC